jgi:putative ABC transport system substrate-binding protein
VSVSRRQFVLGAGAASLGLVVGCGRLPWQGTAPVQQSSPVPRIGFLLGATPDFTADVRDAFRQGLADHGYVDGRDLAIEWRFADGSLDRTPALAAELVALPVTVIVVQGSVSAQVFQRLTSTIPIVVAGGGLSDLVDDGLAASYARPGGQVTGLSIPTQLAGKRLQLLTQAAPGIARVAVLRDAYTSSQNVDYEGFAQSLGLRLEFVDVGRPEELDGALAAATRERADGLDVTAGALLSAQRGRIIAFATEHRLPAMYGRRESVADGGLMSYEPRRTELYRRAAYYVDRILKGAKPADLPVEQPMIFEFVVNLKTAQALGITFPNEIMLQVTEVVQ